MAERVLFTCVGTSDPVREMRDGSMLHIMRHYRPEKVYIFLSKEIADFSMLRIWMRWPIRCLLSLKK